MNTDILKKINLIIERDSKDTTYKLALLRSVIDVIQEYSHLVKENNNKVILPVGLLIEKWLIYYYPIINSTKFIPQRNGETSKEEKGKVISFRQNFKPIINYYEKDRNGGFSGFYNDLKINGIPDIIKEDFVNLLNQLFRTITTMPMKYLGNSINNNFYSVFEYNKNKIRTRNKCKIDLQFLINYYGTFSFDKEIYFVFEYMGRFISGTDSLLFKWAEFSVKADKENNLKISDVLNEIFRNPVTERDVFLSKELFVQYKNENNTVFCTWTGRKIKKYDIDHIIPFSVWKNNNLWNLLPVAQEINKKKRDKIASPALILKQKDIIVEYWRYIENKYSERFYSELNLSLIGFSLSKTNWENEAINCLIERSKYLIQTRGFEEWTI